MRSEFKTAPGQPQRLLQLTAVEGALRRSVQVRGGPFQLFSPRRVFGKQPRILLAHALEVQERGLVGSA